MDVEVVAEGAEAGVTVGAGAGSDALGAEAGGGGGAVGATLGSDGIAASGTAAASGGGGGAVAVALPVVVSGVSSGIGSGRGGTAAAALPRRGASPSRKNPSGALGGGVVGLSFGGFTAVSVMDDPSETRARILSGPGKMSGMSDASIKDRLQHDLTAAMKARDDIAVSTIRMLRAAITNAEVAGDEAVELTDDQAVAVLRSEAKKRTEAAAVYEENGRAESAAKERAELEVIERYLPAAMSDEALAAIVDEEVARAAESGAEGGKAMGIVIKAVRDRAGDGADGARIAAAVKARLQP